MFNLEGNDLFDIQFKNCNCQINNIEFKAEASGVITNNDIALPSTTIEINYEIDHEIDPEELLKSSNKFVTEELIINEF